EDLMLTGFSVMRRRALGEHITVAQNVFEPEPSGPLTRPSVEQDDAEQDGLKIVLASATPQAARTAPKTAKKKAAHPHAKGRWTVPVGAFKATSDANPRLAHVKKRHGAPFTTAKGVAASAGVRWRAQFTVMSESNAKAACRELEAKKQPCLVLK